MATRTDQQPLELFRNVGCHAYLVRYLPGREDEAAEAVYRFVENDDLNFDWTDAEMMSEPLDASLASYVQEDERFAHREYDESEATWNERFYLSAGLAVWAVALVALWSLLRRGM